jgi:hypothetical protein
MLVSASDCIAFDRASARTFDTYGRMHVTDCKIGKACVSPYLGREIPNAKALGLDPNKVYKLYRDPAEMAKSAAAWSRVPLLLAHTKVTAAQPRSELVVGAIGNVSFDGVHLACDALTIWDADGITLVESEHARELSPGYGYRVEMTPGVDPDGVAFDGAMRDIKPNHVTLVPKGRQGSDVIVNDALPSELQHMKRPLLLAHLVSLGLIANPTDDASRIALDASLAAMTTGDGDDMEDDPENPGKRRKKGAGEPGKVRDGKDKPGLAMDEAAVTLAVDSAIKARGYITKEDADKLAQDAASDAVARVNSLHEARVLVKPLVGDVAMDSAEAVYRFALGKEGIALDGVHASAFPALVRERIARRTDKPAAPAAISSTIADAIPGLGRFNAG